MLCLLGLKEVKSSIIFDWIAHYRCLQYRASSDGTRLACNCLLAIALSTLLSCIMLQRLLLLLLEEEARCAGSMEEDPTFWKFYTAIF